MLVGTYKFHDFVYNIRAHDFGTHYAVGVSCDTRKGVRAVDRGIHYDDDYYPPLWDELYCQVNSATIVVDCSTITTKELNKNGNPILMKTDLDSQFFIHLGSILRGVKAKCSDTYLMDNDLFTTNEFNPRSILDYRLPDGTEFSLKVQTLVSLKYSDAISSLELSYEDDDSPLWHDKTKTTVKYKLDLSPWLPEVITNDWDLGSEPKIYTLQEIIEMHPDRDYAWLNERKYYVVNKMDMFEEVCKKIWHHGGIVAFDTETTGLNFNVTCERGEGDRLVGLVFSIEEGTSYYIPIAHKKVKNICTPNNEGYIIEKYIKPILEKKTLLTHNGAFDWKVMYAGYGVDCNIRWDTYILFKVTLGNANAGMKLGLKELVRQFLHRDSFELKDFVDGKFGESVRFWDLDEESVKYYACPDTDSLLCLFNWAMREGLLEEYNANKVNEIETLFSIVIAYQEYYGHHINISEIDALVEAITRDKEVTYKTMYDIVGYDFNPKSAPQLQKVCFETLKLPIVEYTDSGNPSAGKIARKTWMKNNNLSEKQHSFVANLHKYLDARTLESNFTKNINKFATQDGLMFSRVTQFLATGRVSTADPNYQGYSDTVKKYVTPREGFYGMDADYSTVEARIMVSMAGCRGMVEKLKDPDTDYHRQKASDMFSVPYELVTDALRKMAKGVNFGILYGLGDPNLGKNLYGKVSPENTRKAKEQKKKYFKGMEELEPFIETSKRQGTEMGYSLTYFNRRRVYDRRLTNKNKIERESCNARIQGTAADLYKLAMVRLFQSIRSNGWMGKVLISAFVHDECYLEVHKSIDPMVMLKVLRDAMMIKIEGWCPLFIGAGFGRTWYEAKHTEIPVQLQDTFINNYGKSGVSWWTGDTNVLCDYVSNAILDYKRDRVINYLKNQDNWGKILKPVENELAHSLLYEIQDGVKIDGCVDTNCEVKEDMLENLKEFCRVFDCLDLYEKANIQKPSEETPSMSDTPSNVTNSVTSECLDDPRSIALARVNLTGAYINGGNLYFKYMPEAVTLMNVVEQVLSSCKGDLDVYAIDEKGNLYSTDIKVSTSALPKLIPLYLSYKNRTRG